LKRQTFATDEKSASRWFFSSSPKRYRIPGIAIESQIDMQTKQLVNVYFEQGKT